MKPLTWNELAEIYRAMTGKTSLPMNQLFDWAATQRDKFTVDTHGCLYWVKK